MKLAMIYNLDLNLPKAGLIHNPITGEIGLATYDEELSSILELILNNNNLFVQKNIGNKTKYDLFKSMNEFYLNYINDFLPFPYKILLIKNINGKMENCLNSIFDLLNNVEGGCI